ncbi:MAG TPA: hypothetical protein VF803_03195 [Candidatus Paceibacterota bacterium]
MTELSEESAERLRRIATIVLYCGILAVSVWLLSLASRKLVATLPSVGHMVASPFMAIATLSRTDSATPAPSDTPAASQQATSSEAPANTPAASGTESPATSTPVTTPAPATTPTSNPAPVVNNSPAHLTAVVLIIDVRHAQFRIINTGGQPSRSGWSFTATLPVGNQMYLSPAQPSLEPGRGYTYTLDWSPYANQPITGGFNVTINP